MWYAALVRFIRRRIVLGIIFTLSLMYCIASFVRKVSSMVPGLKRKSQSTTSVLIFLTFQGNYLDGDDVIPIRRTQPFIWRTLQQHNASNDADMNCRNSVQGKVLIVDDRGNNYFPTLVCQKAGSSSVAYCCLLFA